MNHHEFSRSGEGEQKSTRVDTIGQLIEAIARDETMPARKRADICSGVRSLLRAVSLPESIPADPRVIAERLAKLTPAGAGMSKGRLQNCRAHMGAAFAYADARFRRRRNREKMPAPYQDLLDRVPDRFMRARLRRLFHFAADRQTLPGDIDGALFDDFLLDLEHSAVPKFRSFDREVRKLWNHLVQDVPGWPGKPVMVPTYVDHYVLPPSALPKTFWDDCDAYLDSRSHQGSADIDDILSDEELFNVEVDSPQRIRDSTSNLVRYRVRQFASALVHENVMAASDITDLKALVAPQVVNAGLKFFVRRADGEKRNSQIHGIASDLLMIARLWVRSAPSDLTKLSMIAEKVRPTHEGLPESARRSLAPFRDPDNVRRFLALPDRIVREAEAEKTVDRATANRVAAALWMKIAQRAPLRISNLLSSDLTKNILRAHNGKDAPVALYYPPEQVKNNKALEVPLPRATVTLLDLYLQKYRKALVDVSSNCLFPAADGRAKRGSVMSADIQKLMQEHIGFAINPHSFRHVAAKLYLTAHPGRYADVQLLLGHRKLETTVKYYCEIEAEEAFRHFDAVLLNLEDSANKEKQ